MVAQENTRMLGKGQSVKLIEIEWKIRCSYEPYLAPPPRSRLDRRLRSGGEASNLAKPFIFQSSEGILPHKECIH